MASERDDDGPERKESVKYWENNRRQSQENAGWSLDYVSAVDSNRQTIWIADGHRDGRRFIVRADEKLAAFVELEAETTKPNSSSSTASMERCSAISKMLRNFEIEELRAATEDEGFINGKLQSPKQAGRHP